jgi:toxin ParE1/3/4
LAAAIDATLEEIGETPDRHPENWPGVREALVNKWPYCIDYQVHDDHVMVIAVFHTSRDPQTWQRRA